jgi:predicted DNA-binding transcriptional regulator AlpA
MDAALPFSRNVKSMADNMGVSLYQRFALDEAATFLNCTLDEIKGLVSTRKISFIQVTVGKIAFFGYQLVQYLLDCIVGEAPSPTLAPADRIIRAKEVQAMTGLSRTTLWRLEREGEFPARVSLCAGSVGWRLKEVEDWIRTRDGLR